MNRKDQIAEAISTIMPKIARHITLGMAQVFHLTPPQVFTILLIGSQPACRACDLSQALRVSAPTVTGIIDRLERAGYVKRVPSKTDRRVIHIELTQTGMKFDRQIRNHVKKQWRLLLDKLSDRDCEAYLDIMERLQNQIG